MTRCCRAGRCRSRWCAPGSRRRRSHARARPPGASRNSSRSQSRRRCDDSRGITHGPLGRAPPRKLMTHSVKRHLDVDADAYDAEIRRFIPYYDDMLATGVELLASLAPPAAHVLDLGGGTGALSAAVLRRLPEARVTVLDVDRA